MKITFIENLEVVKDTNTLTKNHKVSYTKYNLELEKIWNYCGMWLLKTILGNYYIYTDQLIPILYNGSNIESLIVLDFIYITYKGKYFILGVDNGKLTYKFMGYLPLSTLLFFSEHSYVYYEQIQDKKGIDLTGYFNNKNEAVNNCSYEIDNQNNFFEFM